MSTPLTFWCKHCNPYAEHWIRLGAWLLCKNAWFSELLPNNSIWCLTYEITKFSAGDWTTTHTWISCPLSSLCNPLVLFSVCIFFYARRKWESPLLGHSDCVPRVGSRLWGRTCRKSYSVDWFWRSPEVRKEVRMRCLCLVMWLSRDTAAGNLARNGSTQKSLGAGLGGLDQKARNLRYNTVSVIWMMH